jgi:hypothetical protein
MTLDMLKVSPQVVQLGGDLASRFALHGPRLEQARAVMKEQAADWEALRDVAAASRRRLARPMEPLDARHPGSDPPREHVAIATDGSQIEPDRHGPADFFLLNVGWAVVRYGPAPYADLASEPKLYYGPEQVYITYNERRVPIQDRHLAARRAGEELRTAADLAEHWQDEGLPVVVLVDGTLLLWVLDERPADFLRTALLEPYIQQLERIRALRVPLASYISRPRSVEVSGLLAEANCRPGVSNCEPCAARGDGVCALDRLPDRELFRDLALGERSAQFEMTLPEGLAAYYEDDLVPRFCYLNVGSEIARLEVPPWTADDPEAFALVQAVVLDQCQKGLGYPNVLARAHEQAIVTGADRLAFDYLLESVLARQGVPARHSEKAFSKRMRAV